MQMCHEHGRSTFALSDAHFGNGADAVTDMRFGEVAGQLNENIAELAPDLLGEPNQHLSTRQQLRFGNNGSIAVEIAGARRGEWFDHENNHGGDGIELICVAKDLDKRGAFEFGRDWLGIVADRPNGTFANGAPSQGSAERHKGSGNFKILAKYPYHDEAANLLYEVVRLDPKNFRQRRPDGHGKWIWETKSVRKVLYRLPELIAAPADQWIFVVEGEKDVGNLVKLGLIATTNPGGAAKPVPGRTAKSKWRREYNQFFRGRRVCILPDNDECGRAHALDVARNLAPLAAELRVVMLTGTPEKGDVSDWLAAGGTRETLDRIVQNTPAFEAEDQKPHSPKGKDRRTRSEHGETADPAEQPARDSNPDAALADTEDEVALEFSRRHGAVLRYVNPWRRWLQWDARRWRRVDDLIVFHLARSVAREYAKIYDNKKLGKDAATAAVERAARNDRRHDTPADAWDADLEIFNTLDRKGGS